MLLAGSGWLHNYNYCSSCAMMEFSVLPSTMSHHSHGKGSRKIVFSSLNGRASKRGGGVGGEIKGRPLRRKKLFLCDYFAAETKMLAR